MRIFLVFLAIVATHFETGETRRIRQHDGKVCQTQECRDAAEYIKGSMDSSVDPCDDFYDYACGGWMKKNPIPAGSSYYATFNVLGEKNEEYLRDIMEEGISDIEGASEKLMKMPTDIYKSCMNTDVIEQVGDAPLKKIITKIGGWPKPDDWDEDSWDFSKALQYIQRQYSSASGPLFYVDVWTNPKDNANNAVAISQVIEKVLNREVYLEKPELVEAYKQYMIKVGKLLTGKDISSKAKEIIDFLIKLAEISVPLAEFKWEFTMTLKDLKKEAPEYDWEGHLNAIFAPVEMEEDELLVIPNLAYLKKVGKLVKETPKRVLANYLGWRFIEDEPYYLPKAYRDARQEFDSKKEGTEGSKKRWRTCVTKTNDWVGDILGAAYIKKHFDKGTKELAVKMIDRVREAFKQNVNGLPWMDSKTKAAVTEKVNAMKVELGFPDYYVDAEKFPEKFKHYENVVIRDNRYFRNRWNLMKMFHKVMLKKLRKPVDKDLWRMNPQVVNAMNSFSKNTIVFPAGILQKPFFYGNGIPCALSYGAIGTVIAHEITHGFDDSGMYYDKNGEVLDTPWWTNKSISEFKTRMKCLEDQYSNYKVGGKYPLNGKLTLGENIADNGGFMATSKAYYEWLKENGNNLVKLPGIDLTNEQLMFLGLGQTFCQNKTPEKQYQDTLEDVHTENKFRIIGILSNSHEFAKAFKCKKNSPMNPDKKCASWSKEGPLDL